MTDEKFTEEEQIRMVLNEAEWAKGEPSAIHPRVYRNLIIWRRMGLLKKPEEDK